MLFPSDLMKKIVALCKRRGFIYPGSEIYGGFANTYSYGPYGVEVKKMLRDLWWKHFVQMREDILGLDGPILLHPKTWQASGHLQGFSDALVDCKECKSRFRVDHLLEEALHCDVEGLELSALGLLLKDNDIPCPKCGKRQWTDVRHFNLMFSTHLSKTETSDKDIAYLRPETAQAIFLDFKNILNTMRVQIPFGIAQVGKAFRNEITPGNFLFRLIEFEQMEIEYFIHPLHWETVFNEWVEEMYRWCDAIGLSREHLTLFEHPKTKLSHYSKRTVDLLYDFPFGRQELYGLSYRTDFDLSSHSQLSNTRLEYTDPKSNERWIPHVVEPTFGLDRTLLALLCDSFEEETLDNAEVRTVLHLSPVVAPVKAAVFPLMKKEGLVERARGIYETLRHFWNVEYDDAGAIGRRYRRQDEIGTPLCVTLDYQSLEDRTVTVRHRDTMQQERYAIDLLPAAIADLLGQKQSL